MARHGVLAKGEPLGGRAGLFAAYYGGRYQAEELVAELGTRFVSLDRCVKAMPGTLVSHAFAEAALKLMQDHSLRSEDLVRVRLDVGPWGNVDVRAYGVASASDECFGCDEQHSVHCGQGDRQRPCRA